MRRARWLIARCAALFASVGAAASAETITAARFTEPTTRYAHGVLGDAVEWGALEIDVTRGDGVAQDAVVRRTTYLIRLPLDHVFEDIEPRLVDVTGDATPEVIVVETDVNKGAALAIYSARGKLAETPHIGQSRRWLAPIGAADLDGDVWIEIAYIDRPHLARVLRVWRYQGRKLTPVADLDGLTNHRIGWPDIPGGIRSCGGRPEMITANADWSQVMATTYSGSQGLRARAIAPYTGKDSLARAMICRD